MRKLIRITLFVPIVLLGSAQVGCQRDPLPSITMQPNQFVIEDTVINSTTTENVEIIPIKFTTKTLVFLLNNRISARNSNKHIILLGNEESGANNHMLDGATITGNKIVWTGNSLTDDNEGILLGYSTNATIKYNFIQNCPYGTPVKGNGMEFTSGGIAYNIYGPSFSVGASAKGIKNLKFYNNIFYNNRNIGEGVAGSIYITSNNEDPGNPSSSGCEIYNNIFYTKHEVPNIQIDSASLIGLKCDYNVYYCEDTEPIVKVARFQMRLSDWRKKGFDTHSVVINPNFIDLEKFIPAAPLNYGIPLDSDWQYGLDPNNQWNGSDPLLKMQSSSWQVGAYVVN